MTDAELLDGIRSGSAEAWSELYRRYVRGVWRYAYALTNDTHLSDDVVAETMLMLVKHAERLDPNKTHVYAWLRSVVRNKVNDWGRQRVRADRLLAAYAESDVIASGNGNGNGDAGDPAKWAEDSEALRGVAMVLDRMPETSRLALEWKYLDGQSVRQIASQLGMTEHAVQSTLYRARQEFRQKYETLQKKAAT